MCCALARPWRACAHFRSPTLRTHALSLSLCLCLSPPPWSLSLTLSLPPSPSPCLPACCLLSRVRASVSVCPPFLSLPACLPHVRASVSASGATSTPHHLCLCRIIRCAANKQPGRRQLTTAHASSFTHSIIHAHVSSLVFMLSHSHTANRASAAAHEHDAIDAAASHISLGRHAPSITSLRQKFVEAADSADAAGIALMSKQVLCMASPLLTSLYTRSETQVREQLYAP